MDKIHAGTAYRVINNKLGTHIQGATVNRITEFIMDCVVKLLYQVWQ